MADGTRKTSLLCTTVLWGYNCGWPQHQRHSGGSHKHQTKWDIRVSLRGVVKGNSESCVCTQTKWCKSSCWLVLYQSYSRVLIPDHNSPNLVSIGFGSAMKTGSSRWFKWYPTTCIRVSSWLPLTVDYGYSWLISGSTRIIHNDPNQQ